MQHARLLILLLVLGVHAVTPAGLQAAGAAEAPQAAPVVRVGMLSTASGPQSAPVKALKEGLRQLGYVEDQNLIVETRYGEGKTERPPALAVELVGLRPNVIVTLGPSALHAAQDATTTIPIVFSAVTEITIRATRLGENVTGIMEAHVVPSEQRLVLLKEAVPSATRMAILRNPNNTGSPPLVEATERAAQAAGVALRLFDARHPDEVVTAFGEMSRWPADAVIVLPDSVLFGQRDRIVDLALKGRLPSIAIYRDWAEAGGLMSYGTTLSDTLGGPVASYIDKLLKGAHPRDLPVTQDMQLELVINLKTAQAPGLTIPQALLRRANKTIE